MANFDINDVKRRMGSAVEVLRQEFAGLRTGRASAGLLEPITVEVYGSKMPINQVGTVSVPDARMITVQVWDQKNAPVVEKAIRDSGLGLNPSRDGALIRVPIPQLSQERRTELTKIAHKYAEQARVAVRNVRRDGMDALKKAERDGAMSQDEHRTKADDLQKVTDLNIKTIDQTLSAKEHEIMQV